MTWTCPYCHDEMDEKFRPSHTRICELASKALQVYLDYELYREGLA